MQERQANPWISRPPRRPRTRFRPAVGGISGAHETCLLPESA
jgi:hypothetical protein